MGPESTFLRFSGQDGLTRDQNALLTIRVALAGGLWWKSVVFSDM